MRLESPSVDDFMQDLFPIRTGTSPSYGEDLNKKLVESSSSSDDDEKFTKKAGGKS